MNFDIVVENKILEAIEAGLFDNLPGMGKPLKLDDNPHEPAAWKLAHQMIKDSGYTLPWIDERKEIEELVEKTFSRLAQAYRETHRTKTPDVWARAEWQQTTDAFIDIVTKLNKRIRDYNLQTPSANFQRALVDANKEIERVQREAVTGKMWKAAGS
jgi:DnaJ homolog subfamily C member 28